MGDSLTQRRRVVEEALRGVKTFFRGRLWRYPKNKSLLTTCPEPRWVQGSRKGWRVVPAVMRDKKIWLYAGKSLATASYIEDLLKTISRKDHEVCASLTSWNPQRLYAKPPALGGGEEIVQLLYSSRVVRGSRPGIRRTVITLCNRFDSKKLCGASSSGNT